MNTTVKFVNIPFGEYYEKWSRALAANEQIDLCWVGWMIDIEKERLNGALLPLDDYAQYAPNLLNSMPPEAVDAIRFSDGKLYSFPAWQGWVGGRKYMAFAKENVELLDDPQGWLAELQELLYENWEKDFPEQGPIYDHVETLLKCLKEKDALGMGYPVTGYDIDFLYRNNICTVAPISASGHYIDAEVLRNDDTFTVIRRPDDYYPLSYAYAAKWFEEGYVRQDVASLEPGQDYEAFFRDPDVRKNYMLYGHAALTDSAMTKELANVPFECSYVFTTPGSSYSPKTALATGTGIPYTSKNPERAMMFADLLMTPEGAEIYNLFAFGIEGKHYEWDENHEVMKTFGGDGQAEDNWDYGARPWTLGSMMFANNCIAYPHQYYLELKEVEKSSKMNPLEGFVPDNSEFEVELANMRAICEEYIPTFQKGYLGANWKVKYDEFRAKMKTAGIDAYLDEVQRQVNEYVKANDCHWYGLLQNPLRECITKCVNGNKFHRRKEWR